MKAQSGLVIRVADEDDYAAINTLEKRCFSDDAQSPRSLRYLLQRANSHSLLGLSAAQPAGYVMLLFRRNSGIARLYSIAVDTQYRGYGLGEALVKAAERAASARGSAEIRLEVRVSNSASRRLFSRMGYSQCGVLPGYYQNFNDETEDGVRMQKNITRDISLHG